MSAEARKARQEDDPTWRARAICRGMDPALWFPEQGGVDPYTQGAVFCGSCPVREECLRYAMEAREEHGMWGGVTPQDRRRLRGRRVKLRTCRRGACSRTFVAAKQESYCSSLCETAERSRRSAERQRSAQDEEGAA